MSGAVMSRAASSATGTAALAGDRDDARLRSAIAVLGDFSARLVEAVNRAATRLQIAETEPRAC